MYKQINNNNNNNNNSRGTDPRTLHGCVALRVDVDHAPKRSRRVTEISPGASMAHSLYLSPSPHKHKHVPQQGEISHRMQEFRNEQNPALDTIL